jgi:hypothetical protein
MSDNMNRVRVALRAIRKREVAALMDQLRLEMQEIELEELEEQVTSDPWVGVKEAFKAGKRIAWRTQGDNGDAWHVTKHPTWMEGFEYKVCEEDLTCEERFYLPEFGEMINLVFTRSGVTGETTVAVRK